MNNSANATIIFEKAVILSLHLASFNITRKGDKDQIQTEADKAMITFGKKLLNSPELQAIGKLDRKIYRFLNWETGQKTLPFKLREGDYLVPLSMLEEIERKLSEFLRERENLKAEFLAVYYMRAQEARSLLGPLWKRKDYPSLEAIDRRIHMEWNVFVIEVPNSLEGVNAHLFNKVKEKFESKLEDAEREIFTILRSHAADLFRGMLDRLTQNSDGTTKRLHKGYVATVKEFIETFRARNICNDVELMQLVEQMKRALEGVSAQNLRDDESLRGAVRQQIQEALNVFESMVKDDSEDIFEYESEEFSDDAATAAA